MRVLTTRAELADARVGYAGSQVALVPTMGALHRGHRALIQRAHDDPSAAVFVSVFVNPLQFGPAEDLSRYPRPIDADLATCAELGVDVVFHPDEAEMYPHGKPGMLVCAGELGDALEGRTRPRHFDGVLTVVAKLFHLVAPTDAYFGEKDAQQLALVRRMVRDLDFPIEIVGVPTVRDADGLALSSRNVYLNSVQRRQALALNRALDAGRSAAGHGAVAALDAARAVLAEATGVRLDYLELVDAHTFGAPDEQSTRGVLLVAAYVGGTRLIDNVTLAIGDSAER